MSYYERTSKDNYQARYNRLRDKEDYSEWAEAHADAVATQLLENPRRRDFPYENLVNRLDAIANDIVDIKSLNEMVDVVFTPTKRGLPLTEVFTETEFFRAFPAHEVVNSIKNFYEVKYQRDARELARYVAEGIRVANLRALLARQGNDRLTEQFEYVLTHLGEAAAFEEMMKRAMKIIYDGSPLQEAYLALVRNRRRLGTAEKLLATAQKGVLSAQEKLEATAQVYEDTVAADEQFVAAVAIFEQPDMADNAALLVPDWMLEILQDRGTGAANLQREQARRALVLKRTQHIAGNKERLASQQKKAARLLAYLEKTDARPYFSYRKKKASTKRPDPNPRIPAEPVNLLAAMRASGAADQAEQQVDNFRRHLPFIIDWKQKQLDSTIAAAFAPFERNSVAVWNAFFQAIMESAFEPIAEHIASRLTKRFAAGTPAEDDATVQDLKSLLEDRNANDPLWKIDADRGVRTVLQRIRQQLQAAGQADAVDRVDNVLRTLMPSKKARLLECAICAAPTLLGCNVCKQVAYCSKQCQQLDWTRCHGQECAK